MSLGVSTFKATLVSPMLETRASITDVAKPMTFGDKGERIMTAVFESETSDLTDSSQDCCDTDAVSFAALMEDQEGLGATPAVAGDDVDLPEVYFCSAPASANDGTGQALASAASTASDASTRTVLASWGRYGNNPTYSPSMGAVGAIVGLDVTPDFIAGVAARAFAALEPVERALAGDFRHAEAIRAPGGGPAAIRGNGQTIQLAINGQNRDIAMNLPGLGSNEYVVLYRVPRSGGGWNVVAVNPANNHSWTYGDVQYHADPTRLVGAAFGNGGRGLMGGWQWIPNQ